MDMGFEFIGFENDGIVARIVLRRPPLNILHSAMIAELNRTLRDLRSDFGLRALVISAEGKAFSAGVAVEDHLPDKVHSMIEGFHDVFRHLRKLACPTIAAVQGAALGGGCELACFADVVIAAETATFGVPEIKLGVFPPIAAVHFPSRIGAARALRLVLSGEILSAEEALRIGLVEQVVLAAQLDEAVQKQAARFKENSASALHLAKRAFQAADRDFERRLRQVERLYLDDLMKTPDATEGLKAFLEKRAAVWEP